MRLGFVGVGPWAQKLAAAFRECGAEIVGHDRSSHAPCELTEADGFGPCREWRGMKANPDIDALIICAPPDVTTEVALACAKAGKRCVATKPLMWTDYPDGEWPHAHPTVPTRIGTRQWLTSNLYVDLWRLYSPAWLAMKEELRGKKIERIDVAFCGNGPFRSFNGALDYGPHALAFVFDLVGTELLGVSGSGYYPDGPGVLYEHTFMARETRVAIKIGNAAKEGERRVMVQTAEDGWFEFDEPNDTEAYFAGPSYPIQVPEEMRCMKALALRRFCRAFMAGESSRTLEYSIAAQRVLERITKDNVTQAGV